MLRLLIKNPTSPSKNIAEEVPRQNVFSYSYLGILFAMAKNAEIRGLYFPVQCNPWHPMVPSNIIPINVLVSGWYIQMLQTIFSHAMQ